MHHTLKGMSVMHCTHNTAYVPFANDMRKLPYKLTKIIFHTYRLCIECGEGSISEWKETQHCQHAPDDSVESTDETSHRSPSKDVHVNLFTQENDERVWLREPAKGKQHREEQDEDCTSVCVCVCESLIT